MPQLFNRQQIAKVLMITPRRVNQLAKQGVIPKESEGKYELLTAVQGYISYLKERAVEQVDGVISIAESKQRKLAAEAKLAELQYQLESGKVALLDRIKQQWEHVVVAMKTKLQALPNKLTPLLLFQDNFTVIHQILHESITEALNELAKGDGVQLAEPSRNDEGADGDAASQADA